jgi:hypothetical protein
MPKVVYEKDGRIGRITRLSGDAARLRWFGERLGRELRPLFRPVDLLAIGGGPAIATKSSSWA